MQNNFESDPTVAQQLSLLRRGGSDVELGNLLSLPVAGGVLYVEPVYIRATGAEGFPLLQKVLVGYGTKVAFEDTLGQALAKVFGTSSGTPTNPTEPQPPSNLTAQEQLVAAIAAAQVAYEDGRAALAKGDFAAYGLAQERLAKALDQATAAQKELGLKGAESPAPSPSASVVPGDATPSPRLDASRRRPSDRLPARAGGDLPGPRGPT